MASSPLLGIPRKTTQDVDFAPAIKSIIGSVYGEDPSSYAEELAALNRCRQDALRGSAGSDLTARDLLFKYFGQLELLELRFADLRVPFPWSDAFTHKPISQLSLAYEKASVIFNIGSTLSALAASQSRSSPEGLKRAFNFFRQAAGMLTYINENFLHAPSTDLSKEVIKTLVVLINAQATEIFVEQLTEQRKSPGLKARVCSQAAHLYSSIQQDVKDCVSKGWFPRSWSFLIQAKASLFTAQAQLYKATTDSSASKYGDALRRLMMAADAAKQASAHAYSFSSVFSPALAPTLPADCVSALNEVTKSNLALCQEALTTAKKENDLIYHASITSEVSLPAIEKASVAEPIPIQEVYAAPEVQKTVGQDIFTRLVPLSVHESASMYSEEKAKLVRAQSEAVDTADTEMMASLEYMGLPSSLNRFSSNEQQMSDLADLGPQMRGWMAHVRQTEVTQGASLRNLLAQLQQLKAQVSASLDTATRELDTEEKACERTRVQHAEAGFDQTPSSSCPEQRALRKEIKERRDALQAAHASDDQVLSTWSSCRADAELFIDGKEDRLEGIFVEALSSASASHGKAQDLLGADFDNESKEVPQMEAHIRSIREAMDQLDGMKRERRDVLQDLKEKVQADDISHLLILNRKSQNIEPTLFATELEKFRAHQSRIASTIHHQKAALNEVTSQFKLLTESSKGREIQSAFATSDRKRKELLQRFQTAFDGYLEVQSGASKGVQFYKDLSDYADSIKSRAHTFVAQRNSERQQKVSAAQRASNQTSAALESSLGGLNLGDTGSSALRSPPPPPSRPSSFSPLHAYAGAPPQAPPRPGSTSQASLSRPMPPSAAPSSSQPAATGYGRTPSYGAPLSPSVSTASPSPYPPPPPPQQSYPQHQWSSAPYSSVPQSMSSAPANAASSSTLPPPPPPVSYASNQYGQTPAPQAPPRPQSVYSPPAQAPQQQQQQPQYPSYTGYSQPAPARPNQPSVDPYAGLSSLSSPQGYSPYTSGGGSGFHPAPPHSSASYSPVQAQRAPQYQQQTTQPPYHYAPQSHAQPPQQPHFAQPQQQYSSARPSYYAQPAGQWTGQPAQYGQPMPPPRPY